VQSHSVSFNITAFSACPNFYFADVFLSSSNFDVELSILSVIQYFRLRGFDKIPEQIFMGWAF